MKSRLINLGALLWAVNFLLISHFSKFDATAVRSLNWDIVLMLTPVGLINNFLIHPDSYLRPYYQNHVESPQGLVLIFVLIHLVLTLFLLLQFRRGRRP